MARIQLVLPDEDRDRYYTRLKQVAARTSATAQIEKDQYDVYALWYALPIREMLSLTDFEESPDWISARLRPPFSQA